MKRLLAALMATALTGAPVVWAHGDDDDDDHRRRGKHTSKHWKKESRHWEREHGHPPPGYRHWQAYPRHHHWQPHAYRPAPPVAHHHHHGYRYAPPPVIQHRPYPVYQPYYRQPELGFSVRIPLD